VNDHTHGWFKTMRGADALELIRKNHHAYVLATVIAHRARWNEGFSGDGLGLGEALIGDYRVYGMTRQEYRTALAQLCKWNFATIKPTNDGTIARLTDTRLFDILNLAGNQQVNRQPTTEQPPANQQPTTNEEGKKAKKEIHNESIKAPVGLKDLHPGLTQLMQDAREILGPDEMGRCHQRWLKRAETEPDKLRRVLADTAQAIKDGEVKTTPAKYAENRWKEFAP
jgi:hypothetical protein